MFQCWPTLLFVRSRRVILFFDSPCRAYTPKLAALYNQAKAQHRAFEVVFVSLDGDEESMHRCGDDPGCLLLLLLPMMLSLVLEHDEGFPSYPT